jgi:hypothetical protein
MFFLTSSDIAGDFLFESIDCRLSTGQFIYVIQANSKNVISGVLPQNSLLCVEAGIPLLRNDKKIRFFQKIGFLTMLNWSCFILQQLY